MTFHTLLGELDSLALRVQYFDRAASVVLHDQTYKLAQIGGMLLIIGIFVLQFFTFDIARADPIVPLLINGQPRSVAFIIGLALVIGIGVWLLMLVPALHQSRTHINLAKRRADAAIRIFENRGSLLAAGNAQSDLRRAAEQFWRGPRSAFVRAQELRGKQWWARYAFRVLDSPHYWIARLLRLGIYCVCYVASTYFMRARNDDGVWQFETVPIAFYLINYVSLWTTLFDYTLELLFGGWHYALSVSSAVELLTQPPVILLVCQLIAWLQRVPALTASGELSTVGEVWQLSMLSSDPQVYLLQFGWLRFLSAHRVNYKTLQRTSVRTTRVRVASLLIAVSCIFFVIGGAMFTFEARLDPEQTTFVNYGDFLYFAVVTASTVGYGDFSPSLPISRLTCVIAILVTITVVPEQIAKLSLAFSERPRSFGRAPRAGEPYVLLCGQVSAWHLRIFMRSFERLAKDSYHRPPRKIVVLSPLGVEAYTSEPGLTNFSTASTLFIYDGDLLSSLELGTSESPINLRHATHAFVYGASSLSADDDSAAMLRVLALLNFVPAWSITVLINRSTNLTLAANIGVSNVLCINDLQMRWLSKSVTDTPGIICLMSNLLISASELDSKDRDRAIVGRHDETALARAAEEKDQHETEAATEAGGGLPATAAPLQKSATSSSLLRHVPARPSPRPTHDEDLGNYLLGAESQLLVHGLPRWADGRTAGWLLEAVAHVDGLQLLAVGDGYNLHIFRSDVRLQSGMHGIYIARSDADLERFIATDEPPKPFQATQPWADGGGAGGAGCGASSAGPYGTYTSPSPADVLGGSCSGAQAGGKGSSAKPQPAATEMAALGGKQGAVAPVATAKISAGAGAAHGRPGGSTPSGGAGGGGGGGGGGSSGRAGPTRYELPALSKTERAALLRGERIVVLGAPPDVEKLLLGLLDDSRPANRFLRVTHVCRSRFDGADELQDKFRALARATGGAPRYQLVLADPLDHEQLKPHILSPGLHSVIIFHEKLRADAETATRMDAAICYSQVESMLSERGVSRTRIIVALASTADVRFVERSSWWPHSDDAISGHLTSPTYAAGQVYAAEMVYPLMMSWRKQGLIAFCRYLTDNLLDPTELKLVDLPDDLAARAEASEGRGAAGGEEEKAALLRRTTSARKMADKGAPDAKAAERAGAHGSGMGGSARPLSYGELRLQLLQRGLLPFALYRRRSLQFTPDRVLRVLPFVFTNPPNGTRVRADDRVYCLHRATRPASPKLRKQRSFRPTSKHDASGRQIEEAARRIQLRVRARLHERWNARRRLELERERIVEPAVAASSSSSYLADLGRGLASGLGFGRQ